MYGAITPKVLATEAVMTLAALDGVVAFVEGPKDLNLLGDFFPPDKFRTIHCVNKCRAIEALTIIAESPDVSALKRARIVAIVDSDFDRILRVPVPDRCFVTDGHDIEGMIVRSPAFDRFLREYGVDGKIRAFGGVNGVRERAYELCKFIGVMRLLSRKLGLGIVFDALNLESLINKRTLEQNRPGFCQAVFNANREGLDGMSLANFQQAVEIELAGFDGDRNDLVQGHDLVVVISIMLRFAVGSLEAKIANSDNISKALRLAYRPHEWRSSGVGRAFADYLNRNGLPSLE